MDDKYIDELLSRRAAAPQRPELENRIIEAALSASATAEQSVGWFAVFMRNFLMPRPALALACAAFFGLAIGVYMPDISGQEAGSYVALDFEQSYDLGDI